MMCFSLVAAACTSGDDDATPTTVGSAVPPATTPAPVPSTVPPPTTATSTSTTTTTTTIPPGLQPQVLSPGLTPGTLATYSGTVETIVGRHGASIRDLFGGEPPTAAEVRTQLTGRQRLLALDAGGAFEIVEDFIAETGFFISEADGGRDATEFTRDELLDFKPQTPPVLLDEMWRPTSGAMSGAPVGLIPPFDPLATAALVGPPLAGDTVDVGDSWTYTQHDPLLGSVSIDVEIVDEVKTNDDAFVFVIDFAGSSLDAPVSLALGEALSLVGTMPNGAALVDGLVPEEALFEVSVRSATVAGSMQFDPALGLAVVFDSRQALLLEFGAVGDDATTSFSLDVVSTRSIVLDGHGAASPFEIESVLDRFELDPFTLAAQALFGVSGYEFVEVTDDEADLVFNPLSNLRPDLFAGSTIVKLAGPSGGTVISVALTMAGEFRGAPFVAEEVARFLSSANPRSVAIGGRTAFRITIDGSDWLLYNNESHVFIVIGPRNVATGVLTDLAEAQAHHLWQAGDCLDFTDDFDGARPYAPFGFHALRHCSVDHTYEVIYSEVLPEDGNARFPSDLSARSDATCGRVFHEFTGTTELETALSLIRYLPDADEWAKGSRYFACVVFVAGSDGVVKEVSGRIDGRDPNLIHVLEAGSCLISLFPIDCEDPHTGEIIAVFELSEGPEAPMPDPGELQVRIEARCADAFAEFEVGSGPGFVAVGEITDVFLAWEFGVRRYYCFAQAVGPAGDRLTVTGTFGSGWQEAEERVAT